MKTLFDTSVLVPALARAMERHSRAKPWLDRALGGEFEWVVAGHTLAELYAALTVIPISPRILPGEARRLIRENIENRARIISLTARDYGQVIEDLSERGLTGGVVYDALICKVAQKTGIRRLLTFNTSHFQRVWPEGTAVIQSP